VHVLLGKVYAETGRSQEAIAELKLALADDKDGRTHYELGRLYLKIGDPDSAKRAFEVSERIRQERITTAAISIHRN
jgi:Flp pilus assembly protein TadD